MGSPITLSVQDGSFSLAPLGLAIDILVDLDAMRLYIGMPSGPQAIRLEDYDLTIPIARGSLMIREMFNGYYLYGRKLYGTETFLGILGDGADGPADIPSYDPNDDPDLPETYGFTLVDE